MLNELYSIYRGLDAVGESPEIRHKEIQEPGAGNTTFRVMLDKDGQVESVRLLTREDIQYCWTMGKGNHNQFPAVKVIVPLLPEGHGDYSQWKEKQTQPKETDYREVIKNLSQQYLGPISHIEVWPKYRNKLLENKELLHKFKDCGAVNELFDRYSKSETGVTILDQVSNMLIQLAMQGADINTLKATCALLFGEKLNVKGEVDATGNNRVTLLLDCFPQADIDIYASSREHVPALSRALFELESRGSKKARKGVCSLTGDNTQLVSDKFYNAKLAGFISPILFTKSKGTSGPTVERYAKSGVEAYSMSETLDQELAGSIEFITSSKFKDSTWAKLLTPSLLVAYCKEDWSLPLTPLITGESEIEDFDDYLDAANSVLATFNGKNVNLDETVDFIEIIKVNDGNHKIDFSTTASIGQLIKAVNNWKQACQNSPCLKLFAIVRKNEKSMSLPWIISPQQVMYLSRYKYIRDGNDSTKLPGVNFSDAMKLFLGHSNHTLANRLLKHIADQFQPLLNNCASSRLQWVLKDKAHIKANPKNNTQALNAVTLLALLLFKIGRTKEKYMKDFPFQLGQLCSAMDELHIGYCKSERGGDIPTTLLGNQVYGMALQNPVSALAVLASRRRPYDSWVRRLVARNIRSEDKAITAAIFAQRWMSGQAKSLNEFLSDHMVESSDTYKAELMLGYLAGRPFEETNKSIESENNQGDKK